MKKERIPSDKLWINGAIRRNSEVNEILQAFAAQAGITGTDFLHMNLLAEETLGMANHSLKDFDGEIWLESTPAGYEIILEADVHEEGRQAAARPESPAGLMAKVAEMLNCSYAFEDQAEIPENLANLLPDYFSYGSREEHQTPVWAGKWSLTAYRHQLQERLGNSAEAESLLDELEKSIVARIADEVTIGIRGHKIRLVIAGH